MRSEAGGAPARCPICAVDGQRRTVYRLEPFDVVECRSCGALERDPLPTAAEMEGYYRDPRYIQGGYFADDAARGENGPEMLIFREALDFLARRRVAGGQTPTGHVLDVGAGAGVFLELARQQGWDCTGVELSPELAARAEARSGAHVVQGDFATMRLDERQWDVVTMWDVLEHTMDPGAFLERARSLLAPGGALVVFTIDAASLFNVVADLAWRLTLHRLASPLELLYDKRHNHYFTSKTLRALLARHGLGVESSRTHRAHLGRWLSEPANPLVLAGAEVIDLLSIPFGRPYRQLLYCVAT
jgi:2-polyprenyl-3-methyl-5-hydroxy-6-metoxy-1,4-benzoquinol methylase